jgi:colicin import membrane protein
MNAAVFEDRSDPGRNASIVLAALMHVLLIAVLLFGVRWQSKPPEAVQVELWEPPPPPAPTPAPVVEPPKPAPKVEAPPPPKPEPEIPKPEIVEKKAPPPPPKPKPEPVKKEVAPPKPKPEPKPAPKPVPKVEPLKPRVDDATKRMQEQLAREQASFAIERERAQIKDQLARDAGAADMKGLAAWIDKVRGKIRGNIVLPLDIKGNPEAIFDVVQLPTGEVIEVRLRKSSGHRGYDEAVERAIRKSSPLPRPDAGTPFQRALELRFRPLES